MAVPVEDGAAGEVGGEGGEGDQCLLPHRQGWVQTALVNSQHILGEWRGEGREGGGVVGR